MCIRDRLKAQYEGMEYYQEQDPAVKVKLEQWQDLKFGFFVHWGPYSQKGYCESWTICTEDVAVSYTHLIYLNDENEVNPPSQIMLYSISPARGAKISLLGYKGNLSYKRVGNGVLVTLPPSFVKNPACEHAWTLRCV